MKAVNIIEKIIIGLFGLILIGLGWNLEIYFYQIRYAADGINNVYAFRISVAFTIFLTAMCYKYRKRNLFIIVPLVIYSIFCTISGQSFSYSAKMKINSAENASEENNQYLFNYYKDKVDELNEDYKSEFNILPDDLKDRANWNKNGVQPLLVNIKDIDNKIEKNEVLRNQYSATLKTSDNIKISTKSSYEIFAESLGIKSPTLLKFFTDLLLALFIALMGPIGSMIVSAIIKSFQGNKEKPAKPQKQSKEDQWIIPWSKSRFRDNEDAPTLRGRGEVVKDISIPAGIYNKLHNRSIDLNLITVKGGNLTMPNVSLSDFIEKMNNHEKFVSSGINLVQ